MEYGPCGLDSFLSDVHAIVVRHSVISVLRPHGLQHTWLPCPSPSTGACPNSFPWSRWCHSTILSSVIPFFSCLQSFPELVFPNESALRVRQPKYWSFRFSISPSNECSGLTSFRMDWLDQANLKQWSEMLQFALIMHCAIITCYLGPNFNSLPMISVVIFIVTAKTYWVFTMCVK